MGQSITRWHFRRLSANCNAHELATEAMGGYCPDRTLGPYTLAQTTPSLQYRWNVLKASLVLTHGIPTIQCIPRLELRLQRGS